MSLPDVPGLSDEGLDIVIAKKDLRSAKPTAPAHVETDGGSRNLTMRLLFPRNGTL